MIRSIVHNKDCMIDLVNYPDNSFDLAIVDPPYFSGPETRKYYGSNVSATKVKRKDYGEQEKWEVPTQNYFKELFRVSKNQIIWGCNYFDVELSPGRIIWDKVNGKSSFSDCEIAYCSMHDSVRQIRYMWNGMMQGKSIKEGHIQKGNKKLNEVRIHPTQKPVILYEWLLLTYASEGDKILDTHLGSGSSRLAAFKHGFDFVGYEKDKKHYKAQERRFLKEKPDLRQYQEFIKETTKKSKTLDLFQTEQNTAV